MEIRLFSGCLSCFITFTPYFGRLLAPLAPAWHWLLHTSATNSWRDRFHWISCKFNVIISLSLQERHADSLIQNQHYQVCTAHSVYFLLQVWRWWWSFLNYQATVSFTDQWGELAKKKRQFNWRIVENAVSGLISTRTIGHVVLQFSQLWIPLFWHYVKQINIRCVHAAL